jgi:hypothetical protein
MGHGGFFGLPEFFLIKILGIYLGEISGIKARSERDQSLNSCHFINARF